MFEITIRTDDTGRLSATDKDLIAALAVIAEGPAPKKTKKQKAEQKPPQTPVQTPPEETTKAQEPVKTEQPAAGDTVPQDVLIKMGTELMRLDMAVQGSNLKETLDSLGVARLSEIPPERSKAAASALAKCIKGYKDGGA